MAVASDDTTSLLSVESYAEWDGPTAPGTYSLDGINYADCGLCVVAYTDCNDEGCDALLYADEGTVEIESIDLMSGGSVTVTLIDVVLTEVTVDEETFISTPVANPRTFCLSGEFSGAVTDLTDEPDTGEDGDDGAAGDAGEDGNDGE